MSSLMREAGTDEIGEMEKGPAAASERVREWEGWLRVREREWRLRVEKLGLGK